jgi:hypothetical protein
MGDMMDNRSWFQREFEKTDIGVLSAISWIVILLYSGLAVGFKAMYGFDLSDGAVFLLGIGSALVALYFATLPIRAYGIKCNSTGIMLISLVIVHGIGAPAYFSSDPLARLGLLGAQILVYPAYFVYAILYYNANGRLSIQVISACVLTLAEMSIYLLR